MAQCKHLFDGDGAEDTIVRLPENCGTGGFARLVSSEDVTQKTRFVTGPQTLKVVLDYNFAAIKRDRGVVSFSISSAADDTKVATPGLANMRRSELDRRWSESDTFDLPPIAVNKNFNLYRNSISCPAPGGAGVGFSADVSVDAGVNLNALVSLGYSVEGTIIPPAVTKFQIVGGVNGSASADFTVSANAQGSFDTGLLPIYTVTLAGIDIPGIFQLGPKFGIYGQLNANVGIQAVVKTGVSYTFPDIDFAIPANSGTNKANAITKSNPFVLTIDPAASATGSIDAAIKPKLELGLNILSGLAEASAYLDLTASADLDLAIQGKASVVVPVQPGVQPTPVTSGSVSGTAGLDAGVVVTAGVNGAISGLWEDSYNFEIYRHKWDIFDKSFNVSTPARPAKRTVGVDIAKRQFVCPSLGLKDLLEVIKF